MSEENKIDYKKVEVNTQNLKGGLYRKDITSKPMQSIFDLVDMDKDGILIGAELDMFSGFIDIGNKKKNPESDKLINKKEAEQYVNSLDDKSKMYSIDGRKTWTKEKPEKDNLPKNTKIETKNGYYDVGSSGELIELFVPVYEIKNENDKKIWTTVKPEDEAKILNTKEINYR